MNSRHLFKLSRMRSNVRLVFWVMATVGTYMEFLVLSFDTGNVLTVDSTLIKVDS